MAGRPTKALRLAAIDPTELARDVEQGILHHVARLVIPLGPGYEVTLSERRGDTNIGHSVRELAAYARGGAALDAPVQEYLISLLDVLSVPIGDADETSSAIDDALSGRRDVDTLSASSVLDRLALVVCAALGREAIDAGQRIRQPWLAALAGLSTDHVRRLAAGGELGRLNDEGEITAKGARRLLETRGTPRGV